MTDAPRIPWPLRSPLNLLAALAVALALPVGALTALLFERAGALLDAAAAQENELAATLAAEAVEAHVDALVRHAETYARNERLIDGCGSGDVEGATPLLKQLVESNPYVDRAFLATPAGVLWADWPVVGSVHGESFAHRDWYVGVTARDGTYVSEFYQRAASPQRVVMAVVTPVHHEGTTVGFLAVQHAMADLAEHIDRTRSEAHPILVLDRRGAIARPGDASALVAAQPALTALHSSNRRTVSGLDPLTGRPSLLSLHPVPALGGAVVAVQPLEHVQAPLDELRRYSWFVSLVGFALLVALGFWWLETMRRHHMALVELQDAKDQLTGAIVHDLRNPLTAALAYLELAESDRDHPDRVARSLRGAMDATGRVLALSDLLVDVSRLEDGKLPIRAERADLAALARDRRDQYAAAAKRASVDLAVAAPDEPVWATFDADLTGRVLDNLLTNALKHTPTGGRIRIEVDPGAALRVSDTGEGIAASDLGRLFQKYGRLATGRESPRDTGLGLVFSKLAVEAQGGQIGVESELGRGSTFTVTLPPA